MFFDTHVHLDDFSADGTLKDVLKRARRNGVRRILAAGGSCDANTLALQKAEELPYCITAAVGYDRYLAGSPDCDFDLLREQAGSPCVAAIGETGLDYYHTPETAALQRALFARCLDLAAECRKPAVVHTRDADKDTLAALKEFCAQWKGDPARPGVIHCFTRDRSVAVKLLDLGFYISFSGIITFANADSLWETAGLIPEDRLLIETDSPYLAPVPHRGKRCEPALLPEIARKLAGLRHCSAEDLAQITTANACRLFGLDGRGVSHHGIYSPNGKTKGGL